MRIRILSVLLFLLLVLPARAADPWVVYEGGDGPGKGKHVVLVSGDEEYRSEEVLPALGKILAKHHGFKCTVLFAIDPKTGEINPNVTNNIPGLDALKTADLLVVFTRFRNLPDEQMKPFVDYIASGKPVIGLRTATHAFNLPKTSKYFSWSWNNPTKEYTQGFGRQVLGETWISHHGGHGSQSTRGIIAKDAKDHPILKGVADGDVWGPTDVYGVRLPLPGDSKPLLLGQVVENMKPDGKPLAGKKNDPMMPVVWTKSYDAAGGKKGKSVTATVCAAQDFESEGLRRVLVNAAYWCVGLEEKIADKSKVDLVGEFKGTPFGNNKFKKGVKPADLKMK